MPWVSNSGVDVAGVVCFEGWVVDLTALGIRVEFGIVVEDTNGPIYLFGSETAISIKFSAFYPGVHNFTYLTQSESRLAG